jgi:PPK2 family polyphosphate:nucleotide phosphotransferase
LLARAGPGWHDPQMASGKRKGGKAAKKAAALLEKAEGLQERAEAAVDPAPPQRLADLLRVGAGVRLADVDPRSTPGFAGGKTEGKAALAAGAERLSDLQERLFADAKTGGHSVLLIVQGMDTAGKGGVMRHVVGAVDPQGVRITAFKAPTAQEREHDFLWRIRNALPHAGQIAVFDRSHYEDVLVVRVDDLEPRAVWQRRYAAINRFEQGVVAEGCAVVKVLLHISREEQKKRLAQRLERPDKYWKYNPGDVDERERWDDYQVAYEAALARCSTDEAPWHVVPADRKWYARWAVQQLLLDALDVIDPQWPPATFDVEHEKARLAAT